MGGLRLRAQRPPHGRLPQQKAPRGQDGSYLFRDTEAQRKSPLQMKSLDMPRGACGARGLLLMWKSPAVVVRAGLFLIRSAKRGR